VPLELVSRGFFGESAGAMGLLRRLRWPRFGDLVAQLTWRRLAASRSYFAPIEQLEGLSGAARRRRVEILGRDHRGVALALTAFALLAELGLAGAFYVLISVLGIDPEGHVIPSYDEPGWAVVLSLAVLLGSVLAVMPFYTAAGFALYIARRVDLEGWDLELAYRRLQRRAAAQGERTSGAEVAR
jgi:hypothetical protein